MDNGVLYLLPSGLGGGNVLELLPPATLAVARRLDYFAAENAKSARAFLKQIAHPMPLQALRIETLDEHTPASQIAALLEPIAQGSDCGLISEAGCPAVADPGAPLVRAAHEAGITVAPLVGPSAVLLAVMASGMSGQRFSFQGYLPVDAASRAKRLTQLEAVSERERSTQVFIEAPYRNDALLAAIVSACRPDTLLCVATELTLPGASIRTRSIAAWKQNVPSLDRKPTVFLLYRGSGLSSAPSVRPARTRNRS